MAEQFTLFWGHRLSQWHRVAFEVGALRFDYAEQFMMHAKALLFGDRAAATRILAAPTPKEQQAIGRQVRGFEEAIWVQFREGIVFQGNYARFSQNPDQRELLFATRGTTLVEASPHDRVWGIGLSAEGGIASRRKNDPSAPVHGPFSADFRLVYLDGEEAEPIPLSKAQADVFRAPWEFEGKDQNAESVMKRAGRKSAKPIDVFKAHPEAKRAYEALVETNQKEGVYRMPCAAR